MCVGGRVTANSKTTQGFITNAGSAGIIDVGADAFTTMKLVERVG